MNIKITRSIGVIVILIIEFLLISSVDAVLWSSDLRDSSFIDSIDLEHTTAYIHGGKASSSPPIDFNLYLFREINKEEAKKLNVSDFIVAGGKIYLIKLTEVYIKELTLDINKSLKGDLKFIDPSRIQTEIKIGIHLEKSKIDELKRLNYNSNLLEPLIFYHGQYNTSKFVKYNDDILGYEFDDTITLEGNSKMYPWDKYSYNIYFKGGELNGPFQEINDQDSGFKTKAEFKENTIKIVKERNILFRYFLGLSISIFGVYLIIRHLKNVTYSSLTQPKKKIEIFALVCSSVILGLFFSFESFNFLFSVGLLPFIILAIVLFAYYVNLIKSKQQNHT